MKTSSLPTNIESALTYLTTFGIALLVLTTAFGFTQANI
jgi:hypothetical protein